MKKILLLTVAVLCLTGCTAQQGDALLADPFFGSAIPIMLGLVMGFIGAKMYKKR